MNLALDAYVEQLIAKRVAFRPICLAGGSCRRRDGRA